MNNFKVVSTLLAGALFLTVNGCGGGGGSDAPPAPTTVVIKLSTATTVPLAGATVRLPIPYGTTVATIGGKVDSGIIVPTGVLAGTLNGQARGTLIPSFTSYSAPTPIQKGALKFTFVAYSTAFRAGEFATVTCSFSGAAPKKTDFDTLLLHATDIGGNTVSVGETFTLSIQ